MYWKHPHISKIYEALSVVADDRIEILENSAKVYSSSRNKFYTITYDPETKSIMSNDNSSYWKGDLGYPSIAYLMSIGELPLDKDLASFLKGVPWKDINQKFKNDFDASLEFILSSKTKEERDSLQIFAKKVDSEIKNLSLSVLGKKVLPPKGY